MAAAPVNKTKKPAFSVITTKKPVKKPTTTTTTSTTTTTTTPPETPPPTRLPTTTEQDVVASLYTLVSSGLPPAAGAVKHTASNNASRPAAQQHPHPPPRPAPTTTMTPFVTFIPTDSTTAAQTTSAPTTVPVTSRRPPAMSYTYRVTAPTAPPPTLTSADLDMDSRTTDDDEDATTTGTVPTSSSSSSAAPTTSTTTTTTTTTTSTTIIPSTNPTTPPTTQAFTTWMTSVPASVPTRLQTAPERPPASMTTLVATTDAPSAGQSAATTQPPTTVTEETETTQPATKPVRYTEILTRVPASALVTKRVTEVAFPSTEQTFTAASTILPTTERAEEVAMTTSVRPVEVVTTFDEADEQSEESGEAEDDAEDEDETTTKLYLKISSSETSGPASASTASATSSAEAFTPTTDAETRTTGETSWETVTDQSAASTEQRGTTASTTSMPTTAGEEAESRTESDPDTTDATATPTAEVPSTSTVSEAEALASTTSPPTSPTSPVAAAATPELSLESSNIQTSQTNTDRVQASSLRMASTTSPPTTSAAANKVDTEPASPSPAPQPLWTRVPVVSSAEDETAGHARPGAVKIGDEAVHSHSVELQAAPQEHLGLEAATAALDPDVKSFVSLCNDLAFQMWMTVKERGSGTPPRSIVMSPFAATSTLAMVFLGARGPTSGQMNDVLHLDDMVSFNPHQVMWNVTEALLRPRTKNTGVATAALVRELYSDKNKGKLLDFYKERAQQFYEGHVEEVTFRNSGDLVRRKTNLLVKRQTRGRVQEYMRGASLALRPPLAAFGANIFETDCTGASTEGRDGEMHFVVVPSSRQRRLVPVPAAVWRAGFLAGYDPALDATAVAIGPADAAFSTVLVLPGQQGHVAPGDGLSRLEQRLLESREPGARWARLLRTLLPRPGLELQVPRFSHRSVLNMSESLQRMGLDELFSSEHADLRGLNGVANDLHLSDIVQLNTFSTCGERAVDSRHHVEFYPTSPLASPGRRAARGRRLRPRVAEADDPSIELHPDNVGKDRDAFYARLGEALEAAEARGSSGLTSSEEATLTASAEDVSSSSSSSSSSSPTVGVRDARTFQRIADFEDPDLMKVPLALRPRQARIPEAAPARLRFDRPFLFIVRHNPTGVLLHMGRFNPRLLP
ncbi:hypothetical protein ONE63_008880 [Megalurothrips usitatus]|uniref:Serpin domain-containing protein n=1 Tax=Megalurothrips usitatus TaxID=439358 RepID=A0AAV7XL97_9NEOP|nr:hypothetical protein ONE63_008880 [Megalurothrips usitatus]